MKSFAELQALVDKMEGREKELAAFEGLFSEIGSALADVVAQMEANAGQGADMAKTIAAAIRDLRIAAPAVTVKPPMVNVAAPNVTVAAPNVQVTVPEMKPVVHVMASEQPNGWEFEIRDHHGYLVNTISAKRG